MAWRLDKSVIKGEIDNRIEGRVTGRIWLLNRPEPIVLRLEGNCHRDMAGCLLRFENPRVDEGDDTKLAPLQEGVVGDMTSSRKVRVLELPTEQAYLMKKAGKEVPEHMGNTLYLEWFSQRNGRVVIESVDYRTELIEREWTMSEEGEEKQREGNQHAMHHWMERLGEMVEQRHEDHYDPDADKPMDEFEWERFLKTSDERTDKYGALLEKYIDHPDRDRIVAREMGWDLLEEALDAAEKGVFDEEKKALDEETYPPLVPNPLTEGTDWICNSRGSIVHPLQERACEVAMALWHECDAQGLLAEDGNADLSDMLFEAQHLGTKLAGALNGLAYDEGMLEGGFIVAYLKRAMTYLNEALASADKVERTNLLDRERLNRFRRDLLTIREEMLKLMEQYRTR